MPIEGFDFKEFSKSLAEQAGPALPADMSEEDKQYIVNIVYNFCHMAGEAISNDPNLNFNAEQASIITQFIGEWSFHKSIDVIQSGIDPQFRDSILQKIAFTVFEIAKTAIQKEMGQADMIAVVEYQVKKAYQESLEELKAKGALNEEQFNTAAAHSNIDEMAKQAAQQQVDAQNQNAEEGSEYVNHVSDNKILKLATFAIVLKRLPENKRQGLLSRFSQEDAMILQDYANMDGLEDKLDQGIVAKCLSEIKNALPEPKKINNNKILERLYKIVKNSEISKISNIINKERQVVKSLVMGINEGKTTDIPPRVADIICNHLEEKTAKIK